MSADVQSWDISPETLARAAQTRFGEGVKVGAPYWVDAECLRVGLALPGDISFGANFHFKEGVFR